MSANSTHEYDLQSAEFVRNPYPTFERMRAEAPVYYCAPLKIWMVTRYEHLEAMIRDTRLSSQRARQLPGAVVEGEQGEVLLSRWERLVFFLDGQRHARARGVIIKALTPISMESLRPMVSSVVHHALAPAREQGEVDVAQHLADTVALGVITEAFGVPAADRPSFRQWATDVLKPAGMGLSSQEIIEQVRNSSTQLFDYVLALVRERHKHPGDDLISRLGASVSGDAELEELGYQCINVIGAGYLTSANQISNSVLALLENPQARQALRDDPSLVKSAVEECLRYDSSILAINRMCTEDMEFAGMALKKGDLLFGAVASANRDPSVFPEPDRFDINRKASRHLSFGNGPHYCLGAALVRLELEETLRALLQYSHWEQSGPCEYGALHLQDRGPKTLRIRLRN